jgi:phosphoribosylanthranilate isomerase
MTIIKICGVKTVEVAVTCAEAGADYIGLVFAQSKRQVAPTETRKIVTAVKKCANVPSIVGVFVNTPSDVVNRLTKFCQLNRVQLSGDETSAYCGELESPVFKVMRINHKPEKIIQEMATWDKELSGKDNIFLLDTYSPDKYGGTGNLLDWDIAARIAEKFPIIIAGGLNPDNVGEAIKKIKPWGVDVSSGVETGDEKDMKKINAFIKAVRKADAVLA